MFLAFFPKGSGCIPYVFLIAGYVVALVTADDPPLLIHGVLVLRLHKYLFDSCVSLEVYLAVILTTDVLETFGCALNIWNNYLTYCVDLSWACSGCTCIFIVVDLWMIVVVCIVLNVALIYPVAIENFVLNLINCPGGVIALHHCLPKVSKFILEKLWGSANSFSPVGKCTYDTALGRKTMVTVPLQVLVSVCGFVIHCYG